MRSLVSLSLKITLRDKSKNNTKLCYLLCDRERFIIQMLISHVTDYSLSNCNICMLHHPCRNRSILSIQISGVDTELTCG